MEKTELIKYLKLQLATALAHQGFKRYFANTSWMFFEQILRIVSGILVGIWVARFLGPEKFGVFSYAIAYVTLFSSIAKLGLDSIVIRDLINQPEKRDAYLGTAFWLKLLGAMVMITTIAISTTYTSDNSTTSTYILIIASGIIFQAFEVIDFYFQSKVLSKYVSISKIFQLILSSILKVYLVLTGADLIYFVIISFIDQIILAISFFIAYKQQKLGIFYFQFDKNIATRLLSNSWPLIFSGLAIGIYTRIDQVMIKAMLNDKDVGLYSAAVRLCEALYFMPVLITNSLFPAILNVKDGNPQLYYKRLQRLHTFVVWIAITVALAMTLMSDSIINVLYGKSFADASKTLSIYAWTGVFISLGVAGGYWYIAENLQKMIFYRTFLGAAINICLNIYCIPHWGAEGAAFATLVSLVISDYLYDGLTKRTRPLFKMKTKTFYLAGIR